jgi:hypothetical protein
MKFRAHDTFYVRKGWINKGMKNVANDPEVFVSKVVKPTDKLGIGSNMVKALRYWLQVFGLTEEPNFGKRLQSFTSFGTQVYENDRYIEELGTLELLQYKIANAEDQATSWYVFFNEFNLSEFTKDDLVRTLDNYVGMKGEDAPAKRSLEDDFNCIINTYLPRYKRGQKVDPENNIDSPFGELGLIDIVDKTKKVYKKATPSVYAFHPWVILAILMDKANDNEEISLNELLNSPGNIGKVFNLDSVTMLEILHNVEKTGNIKIVRTAGLDVIRIINSYTFDQCVEKYYEEIQN